MEKVWLALPNSRVIYCEQEDLGPWLVIDQA